MLPPASRIGPPIRVQLIRWAAHSLDHTGGADLPNALAAALLATDNPAPSPKPGQDIPPPPATTETRHGPLQERIIALGRPTQPRGNVAVTEP